MSIRTISGFVFTLRLRKRARPPDAGFSNALSCAPKIAILQVTETAALAQRAAIAKWGAKREHAWDYLRDIKQPALVVNGSNDVIIYTINSYILQQNLPNAQLIIYPDSAHGSSAPVPGVVCRRRDAFPERRGSVFDRRGWKS